MGDANFPALLTKEVSTHALADVIHGTRDFLLDRDCGNWDKLSSDQIQEITTKAELIALRLVETALQNLGDVPIEKASKDGTLAREIVELLPMPQFTVKVVYGHQKKYLE